jgi:AraC family transcriptional regulator
MRKLFCLSSVILILGFFIFLQLGCQKKAEEKGPFEILTKSTEKMTLIYLDHVGPYEQLGPLFGRVAEYAAKNQLTGQVVGIYYDDPTTVAPENLRCEIGIAVPEGTMPDSGYGIQEIPAGMVAYAALKGPYDKIAEDYPYMYEWIEKKGYKIAGPLMEVYLKGGPDVPQDEYVTEVRIPYTE